MRREDEPIKITNFDTEDGLIEDKDDLKRIDTFSTNLSK
jgi:hypothetical protein